MIKEQEKISAIDEGELSPARLETLTDGIFAIAMTILVLDIHVPELMKGATSGELFSSLVDIWPRIASFAISFIILAMFWVAHHTEFRYIKKLDHKLIWLNVFYLLFVSLLPFTAALLGRYPENQVAVIVYAIQLLALVLSQYSIWRHASHHKNLVVEDLDPRVNTLANRVCFFAVGAYLLAIALSFVNVNLTLIIYALIPLPYIFGWIYYLA